MSIIPFARSSDMSRQHQASPTALWGIVATWRRRRCFRRELKLTSKAGPHLIDDIGLTRRQVEEEIAKPFWQR